MKSDVELLPFGVYMFKSLKNFYNSLIKAHYMFSMQSYSLYVKTAEPLSLAYATELQSLLGG